MAMPMQPTYGDANSCATPGQDGAINASDVVNSYFPPIANSQLAAGATSVAVGNYYTEGSNTPISEGDMLMVIQMQDATIDSSNTAAYGSGNVANNGRGQTNLNSTGSYEFVRATNSVPLTGGTLTFEGGGAGDGLVNTYSNFDPTVSQGRRTFQVIRVVQYASLTLSSNITVPDWNGQVGGVLALDIAGNMDFNGFTIDADNRGFRGGFVPNDPSNTSGANNGNYVLPGNTTEGSGKGEGIAGTPRYMWDGTSAIDLGSDQLPGGDAGRGAPGNAGGGGNAHNAGGGGGGNGGDGGTGGIGWEGIGGDLNGSRGLGGVSPVAAPAGDRLIMGGGGGGGDVNNDPNGIRGGQGGGIVYIQADQFVGSGTITSNGSEGEVGEVNGAPDGAGGGGAGGTVALIAQAGNLSGVTVQARGGNGGNTTDDAGIEHGPGGGGGGGVVISTSPGGQVSAPDLAGGQGGLADSGAGIPHGAENGEDGLEGALNPFSVPPIQPGANCFPTLTVTKTEANPSTPGERTAPGTANYSITVTNIGIGGASGVQITDILPSGFTYSSGATATFSGGATGPTSPTNSGSSSVPVFGDYTIPKDGSVTVDFTVNIALGTAIGTYQNPAYATYLDPTRTNTDANRRVTASTIPLPAGNTTYASGSNAGNDTPGSNYDSASSTGEDVVIFEPTQDYGDAPDTYGTDKTAGNSGSDPIGANHTVVAGIHLGATPPDIEADAETPLDGTGDGADEDGITLSTLTEGDVTHSIPQGSISATGTGTLHAWIDFDKDGSFEAGEYANVAITGGVPAGDLFWSGFTAGSTGTTYARFRFTSDASINATTPGGTATDGEVEDYSLTIVATTTGPRFVCDDSAYAVIGTPSAFRVLDPVTLLFSTVHNTFTPPIRINGLAFNPLDNYMYAFVSSPEGEAGYTAYDFVRVSSDGALENIDRATLLTNPTTELSSGVNFNGVMDSVGNFYNLSGSTLRVVSIGNNPAAGTLTFQNFSVTGLSGNIADINFNPVDGFLYGIRGGQLFRIPPTGGAATVVSTTGDTLPGAAGGSWNTSSGISYFYKNSNGGDNNLYAVDLTQDPAVVTNVGPVEQNGQFDAASCTPPELNKDENVDVAPAGSTVTYTYELFNAFGTDIFVSFNDTLTDPNITYNAGTLSTTSPGGGTVTTFNDTQLSIASIRLPATVSGNNRVSFTVDVTVDPGAASGTVVQNQASLLFGANPVPSDDPETGDIDDPTEFTVTDPVPSTPDILLTKRITAINRGLVSEQSFDAVYVDTGTTSDNDNVLNWPGAPIAETSGSGTVESYIAGIVDGSSNGAIVSPGDTIEYTIPFLSNGDVTAEEVLICDRIPTNTTFIEDAFNSSTPGSEDRGIFISYNGSAVALTNANDGDEIPDTGSDDGVGGYYFPVGTDPSTVFPGLTCNGTNDNGAIVVDLSSVPHATGDGIPTNSYGFIRFEVVVN